MWNEVAKPGGVDMFVEWFGIIFSDTQAVQYFDTHPGVEFLHRDTIKILHKVD
jgi:hypothetical protein